MTNKKLMKKIAPVVMSAAVAMTSMPYAVPVSYTHLTLPTTSRV